MISIYRMNVFRHYRYRRLYNRSSQKATEDLLRQDLLFCTMIAEVIRNDLFGKTTDTQKE